MGSGLALSQEIDVPVAHPCILVVEDEFLIRIVLSDSLRDVGYHVIEANSADEALVLLDTVLPDLIISDVRMPGSVDGMGLLAAIKLHHPSLPVIITSGHFQAALALAAGANNFVPKPYSFEPMLRAVQDELANGQ